MWTSARWRQRWERSGRRRSPGISADAKALDVSRRNPDRIVLGADQILSLGRDTLSKPPDRAAARRQIARLSGRTHALVSAFALALAGEVVARDVAVARLTMRPLGEEEIDRYLSTAGEAALRSVGCYEIEALGVHLFDTIEGEHSAILGLPMLPLLAALRGRGLVAL